MTQTVVGLAATFLSVSSCLAQAYKCTIDGKPVFQQVPCDGGVKLTVPKPPDPESREAKVGSAIARGKVFVGMTSEEVIRSWGKPDRINRTVTARTITEQWIYENDSISDRQYLYMEDGVLRSAQTPK